MTYRPTPIQTYDIELDNDLHGLVEQLAESNNDHWGRQPMDQGWTYGPDRNDRSEPPEVFSRPFPTRAETRHVVKPAIQRHTIR